VEAAGAEDVGGAEGSVLPAASSSDVLVQLASATVSTVASRRRVVRIPEAVMDVPVIVHRGAMGRPQPNGSAPGSM
jgi:hypothetical protein